MGEGLKEDRSIGAIIWDVCWMIVAACAFGDWQNSIEAGAFMFLLLGLIDGWVKA